MQYGEKPIDPSIQTIALEAEEMGEAALPEGANYYYDGTPAGTWDIGTDATLYANGLTRKLMYFSI